jgi:hypothetical protein
METTNRLTMAEIEMIVKMAEKYTTKDGFETELRAVFGGEETNVDDRDAPNIYPYKMCCECEERNSCGKYRDGFWVCEECDDGECYECGIYLADEHIFTYEKDGEPDITVCVRCADDADESFREQGYIRDDDWCNKKTLVKKSV